MWTEPTSLEQSFGILMPIAFFGGLWIKIILTAHEQKIENDNYYSATEADNANN